MKVLISPIFDPWYYEFYIKGIFEFYKGKAEVRFSFDSNFLWFKKYISSSYRKDFLYYEIHLSKNIFKVLISADDKLQVNDEWIEKVDLYAKVNVNEANLQRSKKIFPIGPSFGVRYFSVYEYYKLSFALFFKSGIVNPYFGVYHKLSLKRPFFKAYTCKHNELNKFQVPKVFYLNYPWKRHVALTQLRQKIIKLLMDLDKCGLIKFEGGFSKRKIGYHKGLKKYSAKRLYTTKQYLRKVEESHFVINTPAVHGCFGWKFAEYLALGKIILTTRYDRILPDTNIEDLALIVEDNISEIEKSIVRILENKLYVYDLFSKNALNYFNSHLQPIKVIERIHNKLFESNSIMNGG